jgi:hypothetical protein
MKLVTFDAEGGLSFIPHHTYVAAIYMFIFLFPWEDDLLQTDRLQMLSKHFNPVPYTLLSPCRQVMTSIGLKLSE